MNAKELAHEIVRCSRQDRFSNAIDLVRHLESLLAAALNDAVAPIEKELIEYKQDGLKKAYDDGKLFAYEQCARIAEKYGDDGGEDFDYLAADIRKLKDALK